MIARLSRLDESQRLRLGWTSLLLGIPAIVVGVLIAHFALLPPEVDRGIFEFIPRGWPWFTAGQIIAFVGSQLILFGAAMIWVANQPLTWARTAFASFLTWIEFVLLFGVVPSEWLNLSQGPLGWTSQNIAFTIPPWLVLGNEVQISFGAIKDAISGGYYLVVFVGWIVVAYMLQDWGKISPGGDQPKVRTSPYGRPLIRVED
ncbi:MAG TPA: hypothetical protein VHM94_06805 [Acidimicrobiia bacterium]|nr:hypothetical protein [Acidimicrobiia bacterium]